MRQPLCKRLFILSLIFCFSLSAYSQDSTRSATKPPAAPSGQSATKKSDRLQKPARTNATVQPNTAAPTAVPPPRSNAQATSVPADHSLNGQYEDLMKHSWAQQTYRVVSPIKLTTLWKNVNDSLNNYRSQLSTVKKELENKDKKIEELQQKAGATEAPQQVAATNEVEILGMFVDATVYNWIVFGIIATLAIALGIVVFSTTKNSIDAKQHKHLYEEISAEYQTFKSKAKEKELKLARELQTERNTIEELLAKKQEDEATKKGRR
jgi:hypothetical protein